MTKHKKYNKSHYRDCKSKKRFDSYNDALKCGKKKTPPIKDCYYCAYCDGYHLTSTPYDFRKSRYKYD